MWYRHCKEITSWGGMQDVSPDLANQYQKSVNYLLNNDPGMNSNFKTLPISGKRIATASKIYYYSDPLRWTIYDSRVGYAIHQLIFEYSKKLNALKNYMARSSNMMEARKSSLCLPQFQSFPAEHSFILTN